MREHAHLIRAFLIERRNEVHRLVGHLDRNPSALELLALPREETAAILLAALEELARRPFRPDDPHPFAQPATGDDDRQLALVLRPLLRRKAPLGQDGARALLEALLPLCDRLAGPEVLASREYQFPLPSVVKWMDRQLPAWGPEVRRPAARVLEAILAQPARLEEEVLDRGADLVRALLAAGQLGEEAGRRRMAAVVAGKEERLAQVRLDPEALLPGATREAIEVLRRHTGVERRAPRPTRRSPRRATSDRPRAPRRGAVAVTSALVRERLHARFPGLVEGDWQPPLCLYRVPRPGKPPFFLLFEPDPKGRPAFTFTVGWGATRSDWWSARHHHDQKKARCERVGFLLPEARDRWFSLVDRIDEATLARLWAEEPPILATLPAGMGMTFAEALSLLAASELESAREQLGRRALKQLSPPALERHCSQVLDDVFAALERHAFTPYVDRDGRRARRAARPV